MNLKKNPNPDVRILVNLLETQLLKEKKDICVYADLSTAIGRDVQGPARGVLHKAVRDFNRINQVMARTSRCQGIYLSSDYSGVMSDAARSIHKKAYRTLKMVLNAEPAESLSNDEKNKLVSQQVQMNTIVFFTTPKAQKRIEAKVSEKQGQELPTAETLRLFTEKNP
jgi:hypothetical protein